MDTPHNSPKLRLLHAMLLVVGRGTFAKEERTLMALSHIQAVREFRHHSNLERVHYSDGWDRYTKIQSYLVQKLTHYCLLVMFSKIPDSVPYHWVLFHWKCKGLKPPIEITL